MTNEAQLAPAHAGELRSDGTFVIERVDYPNGTELRIKVGKLKIRGEREPRTICYADYAKLLSFYDAQAKLIKDRRSVMVALSDGALVNTADITSLDVEEAREFERRQPVVPESIKSLPIAELLLSTDGRILSTSASMLDQRAITDERYLVAKVHYKDYKTSPEPEDYYTKLELMPEALEFRKLEDGEAVLVQIYKYGIPQLPK